MPRSRPVPRGTSRADAGRRSRPRGQGDAGRDQTDVQGSLEAIVGTLSRLATEESTAASVRRRRRGVGIRRDARQASNALIIAFNVAPYAQARDLARRDGVDIRYYSVIYNVIDDVKAVLGGMLSPSMREKLPRLREIPRSVRHHQVGKVAGCRITEGVVRRGNKSACWRQRRDPRRHVEDAARRLQGRGARGPSRLRMRHGLRELHGHQVGDQIECSKWVQEAARFDRSARRTRPTFEMGPRAAAAGRVS